MSPLLQVNSENCFEYHVPNWCIYFAYNLRYVVLVCRLCQFPTGNEHGLKKTTYIDLSVLQVQIPTPNPSLCISLIQTQSAASSNSTTNPNYNIPNTNSTTSFLASHYITIKFTHAQPKPNPSHINASLSHLSNYPFQ